MNRLSQRTAVLLLLTLGACSGEASGVTPMTPSFAMEGPHAVAAEETDELVYFYPSESDQRDELLRRNGDSCVLCEHSSWSYDKR